ASSLLYEPGMADSLSDFIAKHAAADAEVWVVDTRQSYRGPFKRHMKSDGFEVTDIQCLNQTPCLSGEERYRGRLMKFRRLRGFQTPDQCQQTGGACPERGG